MSIIRVGLAETKNFSDGWDGVFGRKKKSTKVAKTASKRKSAKPGKRRK